MRSGNASMYVLVGAFFFVTRSCTETGLCPGESGSASTHDKEGHVRTINARRVTKKVTIKTEGGHAEEAAVGAVLAW
ncbi:hypothetical protein DFH08DRAFT_876526, partial [Mycena albidolilacea]